MINLQKTIRTFKEKVYSIDEAKIDKAAVKVQRKLITIKNKVIKKFKDFTSE